MGDNVLQQLYRFQIEKQLSPGVFAALDEADQSHVFLLESPIGAGQNAPDEDSLNRIADQRGCESFSSDSHFYFVAQNESELAELKEILGILDAEKITVLPPENDVMPLPTGVLQLSTSAYRTPTPPTPANHWRFALGAAIVAIVAIIVIAAFNSNMEHEQSLQRQQQEVEQRQQQLQQEEDARKKQEADAQAQAQASAQMEEANNKLIADDETAHNSYARWLAGRASSMSPNVITVRIKNGCNDKTIKAALRFQVPDSTGHWVTLGWNVVKPGEEIRPVIATSNPHLYFYAESGETSWTGDHEAGSITAHVVDNDFVQEDGDELHGINPKDVEMFHRVSNGFGEYAISLTCSN
jgi:hypothetical protein